MSEFLTTGQAAELLGVSKPTVVRAVQKGLLRPALVTPGQHRRFRREDLDAFRSRILVYPQEPEGDSTGSGGALHVTGRETAAPGADVHVTGRQTPTKRGQRSRG